MHLAIRSLVDVVLDFFPPGLQDQVRSAVPEVLLDAARLGLEVLAAERAGLQYAQAVRRPRDFPLMQRVHFGFLALLQHEIPMPLMDPVREVLCRARNTESDDLGRAVFAIAGGETESADSAVFRFLIYELIRAGVWTGTFDDAASEAVGCHVDLDQWAEQLLRKRLRMAEMYDTDIRPLEVILTEATLVLFAKRDERLTQARIHGEVVLEMVKTIIAQAEAARRLPAPRAQLLRNLYAEEIGEQELGDQELADRYPGLYASKNAVQQHRTRLKQMISKGNVASRRPRLIDLLREATEADND